VKLNSKMSSPLKEAGILLPLDVSLRAKSLSVPAFECVDGSVLLKQELRRTQHVKLSDFPDRTGYECFINHVHLPFTRSRDSLISCLSYAVAIQVGLTGLEPERNFQIIVSVDGGNCVVRFHEVRTDESWVAENIEGYSEALLVLGSG
jgi:hypothetical protein